MATGRAAGPCAGFRYADTVVAMTTVLMARDLVKTFGAARALDGLSLDVSAGEIHGFLGPNGSGKTVTMRIMLGLLRPDSGTVEVFGSNPWTHAVVLHRRMAYVPGDTNFEYLPPWLLVTPLGAPLGPPGSGLNQLDSCPCRQRHHHLGRRVDHGIVTHHHGGYGLVASSMPSHLSSGGRVGPDVDLPGRHPGTAQLAPQRRTKRTTRSPVHDDFGRWGFVHVFPNPSPVRSIPRTLSVQPPDTDHSHGSLTHGVHTTQRRRPCGVRFGPAAPAATITCPGSYPEINPGPALVAQGIEQPPPKR